MAHPSAEDAHAHWAHLYEGLQISPHDFYVRAEVAVTKRSIPDVVIEKVEYSEGGALSDKRQYLRVRRRRWVFDICGAPFGEGFFFSWWLAELKPSLPAAATVFIVIGYLVFISVVVQKIGYFEGPALLLFGVPLFLLLIRQLGDEEADDKVMALPVIGPLYAKFFRPITYYRIDTSEMFQQAVRNSVMEAIDQVTAAKGLRALTELERKPVMRDFFRK